MIGKSGFGAIPILPQNMLAVNEYNPKVFLARCLYIVIYLCLLGLFISYAVINLLEFLDAQDSPALNSSVKGEEKLKYPVFTICPYFGNVDLSVDDVEITNCGSLEIASQPLCGKKGDKGDKGDKDKAADIQKRLYNCYANKVAVKFPTFVLGEPNYKIGYGCVIVNLEQAFTEEVQSAIFDDKVCGSKPPTESKGGKRKSNEDVEVAYASGAGFADRYEVQIYTKRSSPAEIFSLVFNPSVENFNIRTAEDSGRGFPENAQVALFMRRSSFKCVDCSDEETTFYYNATTNILSVQASDNKDTFTTSLQVYYDSVVTTELEEG